MIEKQSADRQLYDALASLNEIGSSINRIKAGESDSVEVTLHRIVESAIKVIPGSSAVIYTYDHNRQVFDPMSRVSAGEDTEPVPGDEPRPDGMGFCAVREQRRILSYESNVPGIHPIKAEAGARVVACFPMIIAEETVGTVYIYLHEDREFDELELLLLENFVSQAALVVYHTRQMGSIQRLLARKDEELLRLRRAGLLIAARPHLQEILVAILQMALEVTGAQYGSFFLVDKSGQILRSTAMLGKDLSRPLKNDLPIEAPSIAGWVARHHEPVCISDLREEPWASIYYPFDRDLEMRSELAVPLIGASGRLNGVLNLESPEIEAFSETDSHLLQALATQAVIVLQEVMLLDALKEVAECLLVKPFMEVLHKLAEIAVDLLNAGASAIWLVEDGSLVLQAASAGHEHGERIPIEGSLVGQAVLNGEPVVSDDVRVDTRFCRPDLATAQGWMQALVVPLYLGNKSEPSGAFGVYCVESDSGRFNESDWTIKVLTILADYASLSILNDERQHALNTAQEQVTVAETFAALGDIAANLLHQLNNKIGIIPVRVQGIQDKCQPVLETNAYLAENLEQIEEGAREAMAVVRENLSILHPIDLTMVNVDTCVKEAVSSANISQDIRVKVNPLVDLPPVMAGKQSLVLVFANLIENSANAMQGEGTVTIEGRRDDGWVEICVSDTGPGIASELQGRIFEFNYSGHKNAFSGKLGFGLWWVKTLMTRLGGTVTVESDGQHGATFKLRLPSVEVR
ncbi:MAG: GAF domain-containing protein [Anaerolineae bacterium]|nr:GAF domain-containing protein [Anaerolineae bacterium]